MNSRSYLDVILPDVRRRLAERKSRVPVAGLEKAGASGAAGASSARASFSDTLRAPGVSIIAEVKRSSPSKGPIRPALDVRSLVAAYEAGGAAAVSVLTEEDHFGGNLADLRSAAAGTALPLLRKDFVIDPYQIHEARAFGASAVLLIASLLDDRALRALSRLARDVGLDALVEVHEESEVARALDVEGAVIGINNRDLRTFAISLDTSLRLAALIPEGRLLVSESGIRGGADVDRLASAGVDAVLVGESLLRQEDVAAAVAALAEAGRSRSGGGVVR
jgi:indole-3-glycerol phosphate synthase